MLFGMILMRFFIVNAED